LGAGSGQFSGANNLTLADSADWYYADGEFTIHFMINCSAPTAASSGALINQQNTGQRAISTAILQNMKPYIVFYDTGAGSHIITSSITVSENTKTNIDLIRSGDTLTLYVNGASAGTHDLTGITQKDGTGLLTIGANTENGYAYNYVGGLDEVAIWKGVAIPIAELYPQIYEVGAPLPPVASFTTNTTSGLSPLAVQFNDTSTNTPTSWSWKRSNLTWSVGEEFSTDENPVQSFVTGNWSINLTATNAGGSDLSDQITWINVSAPYVPPRSTIQTITHDFGSEITYALVTLTKPGEVFSVSNLTSTTFDLTITNAVSGLAGTNHTVYWCVG